MGTPITASVTVNPTPDVAQPADQVVCNNSTTAPVNFTGSVAGAIFNWINNTTSIGLAASGSGNIASFTAINSTNAPVVAQITVTPQFAPNNALRFNGSNNILVSTAPTVPVGNSNYTIEAWVKPNTISGANGIVGWGNWGTVNQVNAFRFNGATSMVNYWWGNDLTVSVPNVLDGNWHHVAATYNGTTRSIYFDGVLRGSDNPAGHNVPAANNMVIAETAPMFNEYFDGSLDEMRIWNVARTLAQIQASMNSTVPANSAGLAAYYKMDEGTGTTTADYTGNNNNGSFVGSPVWIIPSTAPIPGGCQGTPITFTITVNPTPTVNPVANQVVCNNAPTTAINFTSPTTGGTIVYNWTNNTTSIGLAASGTG